MGEPATGFAALLAGLTLGGPVAEGGAAPAETPQEPATGTGDEPVAEVARGEPQPAPDAAAAGMAGLGLTVPDLIAQMMVPAAAPPVDAPRTMVAFAPGGGAGGLAAAPGIAATGAPERAMGDGPQALADAQQPADMMVPQADMPGPQAAPAGPALQPGRAAPEASTPAAVTPPSPAGATSETAGLTAAPPSFLAPVTPAAQGLAQDGPGAEARPQEACGMPDQAKPEVAPALPLPRLGGSPVATPQVATEGGRPAMIPDATAQPPGRSGAAQTEVPGDAQPGPALPHGVTVLQVADHVALPKPRAPAAPAVVEATAGPRLGTEAAVPGIAAPPAPRPFGLVEVVGDVPVPPDPVAAQGPIPSAGVPHGLAVDAPPPVPDARPQAAEASPAPQVPPLAPATASPAAGAPTAPAEAPPRPATPIPWPARQVASFAVAMALGRDDSINLTLDPVELGRVEVSIARNGAEAHVSLRAERPETLALLQRDRGELERALSGAGVGGGADGRGPSLSFGLGFGAGSEGRERRPGGRAPGGAQLLQADAPGLAASRLPAPSARGLIDLAI